MSKNDGVVGVKNRQNLVNVIYQCPLLLLTLGKETFRKPHINNKMKIVKWDFKYGGTDFCTGCLNLTVIILFGVEHKGYTFDFKNHDDQTWVKLLVSNKHFKNHFWPRKSYLRGLNNYLVVTTIWEHVTLDTISNIKSI